MNNVHSSHKRRTTVVQLRDPTSIRSRPRVARTAADVLAIMSGSGVSRSDLSTDQRAAYDAILSWYEHPGGQVLRLGGYAGTGKSTLVAVLAQELIEGRSARIAFCAFTGQAASVLRRKLHEAGVRVSRDDTSHNYVGTIHSLIYEPQIGGRGEIVSWKKRDHATMQGYDLIVVDEASMVSGELLDDLLSFGLPTLAVGDHGQLMPVAGFGALMDSPDLRLETVHRHALSNPILKLSLDVRENGDLPRNPESCDRVLYLRGAAEVEAEMSRLYGQVGTWADDRDYLEPLDVVSLTYTNRMRGVINGFARNISHGTDMSGESPRKGDHVVCLKNQSGVYNGMRGVIESDVQDKSVWYRATSYFPDDGLEVTGSFLKAQLSRDRTFGDLQELNDVIRPCELREWRDAGMLLDYGYAMTVHKSQGSQFQHVFLFYDRPYGIPSDDFRRWIYTAVTRATEKLYVVLG